MDFDSRQLETVGGFAQRMAAAKGAPFKITLATDRCAALRGWVWFRRWQGAVSVVVCQCRLIEVVQFLLVRPVNPV